MSTASILGNVDLRYAALFSSRTVALTSKPAARSALMMCLAYLSFPALFGLGSEGLRVTYGPRKPEAPVTRMWAGTVRAGMASAGQGGSGWRSKVSFNTEEWVGWRRGVMEFYRGTVGVEGRYTATRWSDEVWSTQRPQARWPRCELRPELSAVDDPHGCWGEGHECLRARFDTHMSTEGQLGAQNIGDGG